MSHMESHVTEDVRAVIFNVDTLVYPHQNRAVYGANEALVQLKATGRYVGLASVASTRSVEDRLYMGGIRQSLIDVRQTHDKRTGRPNQLDARYFEPMTQWLGTMAVKPEQTLYVGNGMFDGIAADIAKYRFLGVATGGASLAELEQYGPALHDLGKLVVADMAHVIEFDV